MIPPVPSTRRPGEHQMQREARLLLSGLEARSAASEHADGSLIDACAAFASLQCGATTTRAARILRRVAASRAMTVDGHRAGVAAFVLWDDGDLLGRARADGTLDEILLRAILVDLVRPPR